jgi:hypothetical protein
MEETYAAVITADVHSHEVNPDYKCLVIDILNEDWFHYGFELTWLGGKPLPNCLQGLGIRARIIMANIMPSDVWLKKLIDDMFRVSPTFAEWLRQYQVLTCAKCRKPVYRTDKAFSALKNPLDVHSERVFFHERCKP